MQGEKVVCDISTGQPRPIIPVADRRDVFRAIHELAQVSIRATQRLMTARVVWRGMSSDVSALSDSYPAFFLLIATTSNKNF
jgi:hypothetical protein